MREAEEPLVVRDDPLENAKPEVATQDMSIRIVCGAVLIELAQYTPAARIAEIVHALEAHPC